MKGSPGFTVMETLASVSLVLLLSAGICSVYVSFGRSHGTAMRAVDQARLLVETDRGLRIKASEVCFPYWENQEKLAQQWISQLLEKGTGNTAEYKSASVVYDSKSRVRGVSVRYTIGNGEYESVCLFSSAGVSFE